MASLRRNRTMPTDGAISKFLYTIMKQLDLKSIDWQEVANQLDITNGHAARMRYSRFKAQMEGTPSQTRKPRATGPRQKKTKPDKPPAPESNATEGQQPFFKAEPKVKDEAGVKSEPVVKNEPGVEDEPMEGGIEPTVKPEPVIKKEPRDGDESSWSSAGSVGAGAVEQESSGAAKEFQQDFADFGLEQEAAHQPSSEPIAAEQKSVVKAEPAEEF